MSNIYGYMRLQSFKIDQNLLNQFIQFGVNKTVFDMFTTENLEQLISRLNKGELIVCSSLEDLGNSIEEVLNTWNKIVEDKGADVTLIGQTGVIDSRSFSSSPELKQQFFLLMGYFKSIQNKSLPTDANYSENASGRPKINLNSEQFNVLISNYPLWKSKEITAETFMSLLNLKKNTFYRIIKDFENSTIYT
jgi:hypothetical protein